MTRNCIDRRRRVKLVFGVIAVAIVMSILLALGLIYLGQMHPRL